MKLPWRVWATLGLCKGKALMSPGMYLKRQGIFTNIFQDTYIAHFTLMYKHELLVTFLDQAFITCHICHKI